MRNIKDKVDQKLKSERSRPITILTVVVVLTWVALIWFGWNAWSSYHKNKAEREYNLKIVELRGTIIYLDEVLTMSARMAAATGNLWWEDRYRGFEPKLDSAIKEAVRLAPEARSSKAATDTDTANIRLVEMENRSFNLVRQGKVDEAKTLLFSAEYEEQKRIYAQGMAKFADGLSAIAETTFKHEQRQAFMRVGVVVLLSMLLIIVWFITFRVVRSWQETLTSKVELEKEIAERKRAEEALLSEKLLSEEYINSLPGLFYVFDEQRFVRWNREWKRITGYSDEELASRYGSNFFEGEDKALIGERMLKVFREGAAEAEAVLVTKDGRRIPYYFTGVRKKLNGKDHLGKDYLIGFGIDITERKRLEEQLRQSHKMEAIGTLAGGIAHDFNNLLMGIQGRTSLMLTDSDSSHPYFEHLKEIEDYVKSAADLTKQLLGFARGGKYETKTTDLNNLITNQNQMFGRTRKDITIRKKYEEDLWTVEVDQGQIQQVVLNLYVNAWQAMPGGGDLYIQTQNVNLDEHYTKAFKASPGKYVKVSVADTGVGMDEVTRQKIFDPFFTTKEMGRGTGLGLASVYGIVKNHQGFINVYSKKGEGATFNIYLPAVEKETLEKKELEKDVLKGSETVLLVDDEDMIIDVGLPMLEKMGYNVLIAKGGKEALEIYQKNEQKIDMVILDLIMPDIGGGDAYDKLKDINPEIKVMLSSGYSIDGQTSEILERGCNGFIQKPFNIKKLSKKIREILDKD